NAATKSKKRSAIDKEPKDSNKSLTKKIKKKGIAVEILDNKGLNNNLSVKSKLKDNKM
ncbi:hypothetical protein K505DRAFT_369276, partial [Melanomma pulvis-pyrius CBS 109.77]